MKKSLALVLLAFALAGCGTTQPTEGPVRTVTHTPAPSPTPQATEVSGESWAESLDVEDRYIAAVHDAYPPAAAAADALVLDVGYQVCETLAAGVDLPTIMLVLASDESIDPELSGAVIGAAIPAFCPEFTGQLVDAIN